MNVDSLHLWKSQGTLMSESENYAFTRGKIRAERAARIKANATTLACIIIPAGLGSLMHAGWAIGLAVAGIGVDLVYFRRAA